MSQAVSMEQTYIMIKPDGVQRGLVAEIIKRFEQKGFHMRALKMTNVTKEHAEKHYEDLSSKCAAQHPAGRSQCNCINFGAVVCCSGQKRMTLACKA